VTSLVAAAAIALGWLAITGRPARAARLAALQPRPASRPAPRGWGVLADRLRRRLGRRRAIAAAEVATIESVFALAAELRAGRPPSRALALVAELPTPLALPLSEAAAAIASGASPGDELRRVAALPGCGGFLGVAAAWDVTAEAGGAVADVLDRLGDVLDAEQRSRAALAAALAGPRTTMFLLASLPLIGLALGQALGANPVQLLLHRLIGWALLGAGLTLDAIGVAWTAAITRRALR